MESGNQSLLQGQGNQARKVTYYDLTAHMFNTGGKWHPFWRQADNNQIKRALAWRATGRIKQILEEYALTQVELASMLGISQGSLSAYIRKKECPNMVVLIRLADLAGLTLEELLKTSKPPVKRALYVVK